MDMANAIDIGRELMMTALILVSPVVAVSLIVGLVISIGQTVTSIQEQTLTFAPRIIAVVGLIIFLTPWYLSTLKTFTLTMIERMSEVAF